MYGAASGFRDLYTLESGDLAKLGQSVARAGKSSMSIFRTDINCHIENN